MSQGEWKLDPGPCLGIFDRVEQMAISAQTQHKAVSNDIDDLGGACVGKSSKISGRLNAVYNRVLTAGMSLAENRILDVVYGGRNAVAAYNAANFEMASDVEQDAIAIEEVRITDGKQV